MGYAKIFISRSDASDLIKKLDSEVYYLAHNEYARPEYTIVKVNNGIGYFIRVKRFFYNKNKYSCIQ